MLEQPTQSLLQQDQDTQETQEPAPAISSLVPGSKYRKRYSIA
jgi:hypothetical protein